MLAFFCCWMNALAQQTITFPSKDNLLITADLYEVNSEYPYMLLCHQARFSRGEYKETALRFNKLGFNCLAIDLRSGWEINDIMNQTAAVARAKNISATFLDAQMDIEAAVDWLVTNRTNGAKIYAVGSSFSASLLIRIATTSASHRRLKALILFSPGEYFDYPVVIKDEALKISMPVLYCSSKKEGPYIKELVSDAKRVKQFVPDKEGEHGSKALWKSNPNNQEYWIAIIDFIEKLRRSEIF